MLSNAAIVWTILLLITCLAGLGLGTSLSRIIDRKLEGVQFKLPDSRFYVVGDKVIGIRNLKIKKKKAKANRQDVEGFADAPVTPAEVSAATVVTPATVNTPAPTTSPITPVPTPSTTPVSPVLPAPQPTGVALQTVQTALPLPVSTAIPVQLPAVAAQATSGVSTTTPAQPFVSASDKPSFVASDRKGCDATDKLSFSAINRKGCREGERDKYDKDSPQHLRMELELLELRRAEISNKLNVNLNSGYRIGCNTDEDCNVVNNGLTKNTCRVDHSCDCKQGNGPFCQHPANYKDPNTMSESERQRFKLQNDLSKFTVTDYRNWLLLYKDHPSELTQDHIRNLQKVQRGELLTANDIPRIRNSPPPNAPDQYLKLLEGHPQNISFVNSETAGPYLASNYTSYEQFIPPTDLSTYRVINPDEVYKKQDVSLTQSNERS